MKTVKKMLEISSTNPDQLAKATLCQAVRVSIRKENTEKTRTYAARQTHLRLEGFYISLSMEHL